MKMKYDYKVGISFWECLHYESEIISNVERANEGEIISWEKIVKRSSRGWVDRFGRKKKLGPPCYFFLFLWEKKLIPNDNF